MAKRNIKKISLITSGILTPIIVASAVTPLAITFTNKSNISLSSKDSTSQNYKYLYNNKYYDSIDEIVNETLYESQPINQSIYYGDIKEAIFDQESKRIDINQLRKYDQSKIRPAYINSFGDYEIDFQKAKKSFINQGLVRYFYLDNKGKMHSTEYDAVNANKENIKVDKVLYYVIEDNEGNKISINPFNKKDINKFLEIGVKNALTGYGHKGFGFEIFRSEDDKQYQRDDLSLLLYENKKDFESILSDAIMDVIKTDDVKKQLFHNLKFNFKISLDGSQNYAYQFIVENISKNVIDNVSPIISVGDKGNKSLFFENISLQDVALINGFINRKLFENKDNSIQKWESKIWTTRHMLNWVAQEAEIKLELSNNSKYKITLDYHGKNAGWAPGDDITIFGDGEGGSVYFKLELQNDVININDNNSSTIINILSEDKNKNKIVKKIQESLIKSFEDRHHKTFSNNLEVSLLEFLKEILDKEIFKNKNNFEKIIDYVFYDFSKPKNKNNNNFIPYEIDINKLLHNVPIKNWISFKVEQELDINTSNNLILTYNGYPVFSFNLSKNSLKFDNNNPVVQSLFDFKNIINENKINEAITNISNSINESYLFDVNNKNIVINFFTNKFVIPSDIKEYKPILRDDNLKQPRAYQNGIWYAMDAYNENLENYINKNNITNIQDSLIGKHLVDPNNFLVLRPNIENLRSSYGQFEQMYYANYLGLENSFNESIESVKNKLIFNKNDLDTAKNRANNIKPSKIVILYNIAGEVMNPGVKLDDDFVLSTTSDAIYDSENNILDNVLRTLIIEKAQDHFYYENDDGTFSLIKNETNFVFDLLWENKHYYFATFKDATNYLYEIIKNKAIKVGI